MLYYVMLCYAMLCYVVLDYIILYYMRFMISKETENVLSSDEIVNAFQAITTQEREYITKEELYAHLTKEMADYCIGKMKGYSDPKSGQEVSGAYDYMDFTRTLFQT